jgi:flagellar motor switch protein FliM
MIHVVLADLSAAFDPVSPVNFRFDRLETNPRFATVARPANAAIMARFRIDMEDRGGKIELVIPYATLEPVRELLLQMFMGEKFGRDSIWESHLATTLWHTDITVDAVLDEQMMPLSQIMNLEVGSQIVFGCGEDPEIQLRCGGLPIVHGRMGRKGENIAIRVEKTRQEMRGRK